MKVSIFGHTVKEEALPYLQALIDKLTENNIEICYFEPFLNQIKSAINVHDNVYSTFTLEEKLSLSDFLICIGGDGTILDAITLVGKTNIPIIGLNAGRLGFLANNNFDEVHQMVQHMVERNYEVESRSLLELVTNNNLFGENNFCLNEVTIHRKDSSSMVVVHAYINNEYLNSYWADGVIIATPTGSTAYSLSCGGPILMPSSKNFIITPVAPHNLNVRPIVVPDSSEIKLTIEGREELFLVTLDSRTHTLTSEDELVLRKAPYDLKLIKFKDQHFFKTIRNKLLWGSDKRN